MDLSLYSHINFGSLVEEITGGILGNSLYNLCNKCVNLTCYKIKCFNKKACLQRCLLAEEGDCFSTAK